MNTPKTALLVIGSAKPAGASKSEALGRFLIDRLGERGIAATTTHLARALATEERTTAFLAAVDAADIVILAFPLYVDSLPYLATKALERIAAGRQSRSATTRPLFLAVANCGFPEAAHNAMALAICEQFAAAAGFAWAGGLALGSGGAIPSRLPAEDGGMLRNVVAALNLTAAALAQGEPAPAEAVALMAQPLIPTRAYMIMGGLGWVVEAARHGALTKLRARPFAPPR
jgi:hypothetical protein